MRDIYHQIVKMPQDLSNHSTDGLIECRDLCSDAVFAITSALTLIGNLTMDATNSEDYTDEDARRDLYLLGMALRTLPRLTQALEQNSCTAEHVLQQRKEGVK